MAKKFKKFFALVMVASMLVSMLPVQALADETETTIDFESLQVVDGLDVNMTIDGDKIVVEFAPTGDDTTGDDTTGDDTTGDDTTGDDTTGDDTTGDDTTGDDTTGDDTTGDDTANVVENPEGSVEWESGLTLGDGITPEVEDITVTEKVEHEGDPVPDPEGDNTATEGDDGAVEDEGAAADGESVETTTSSTTTTVTESVTVGTEGTLENGAVVEGEENYTETTTNTITTTTTTTETETYIESVTETTTTNSVVGVVEGKETITEEIFGIQTEVTVDVPLTEDDPATEEKENVNVGTGDAEGTVIESEGEKPEQIGEGEYNYSETTVKQEGTVTITTTEIEITENVIEKIVDENGNVIEGTDLDYVYGETAATKENGMFVWVFRGNRLDLPEEGEKIEVEEGYEYKYLGAGNSSSYMPAFLYDYPAEEGEEPVFVDDEGNKYYIHGRNDAKHFEYIYQDGKENEEVDSIQGIFAVPQQFVLVDAATGELITTYCADADTPTVGGYNYYIENLEDADYYDDEQAAMIRVIASNGYWGTVGTEIGEDGNEVPKKGSLEAMRQNLLASGEFTEEELQYLNEGVALTVTQMSIWNYSNEMSGMEFLSALRAAYSDENGELKTNWAQELLKKGNQTALTEEEKKSVDLMYKLYEHMINLEPEAIETPTTSDTIINADNFVEEVSVTVIEKVVDHENNLDKDEDNDTYKTNVSFALVVKPSTENGDDLIVQVVAADGTVLASGRVAGELKEGETQLDPDEEGNYTFKDIEMTEGEQNFKLTLEGIQHLKEGVYLYTSEIRQVENDEGELEDESSQTLVGVASGDRAVSVEMNIKFDLDVKDEVVVTERVWRDELDPVVSETKVYTENRVEKDPPADEDEEDPPVPVRYRMTRGVGQLETIIDEEVPLAEVPQTGDNSILWFALIMLSICGLWILHMSDKKCKA